MNRWLRRFAMLVIALCVTPASAGEIAAPLTLRFDPGFILETVARHMKVALRRDIPRPSIFVESATPLRQFQDAMEAQWGFRPHLIANAYAIDRNEIYLSDDPGYYRRLGRSLDESLAHEFVHYLQARYLGDNLAQDACEQEAVEIQQWFREVYVRANHEIADAEAGRSVTKLAGSFLLETAPRERSR